MSPEPIPGAERVGAVCQAVNNSSATQPTNVVNVLPHDAGFHAEDIGDADAANAALADAIGCGPAMR
jgi:hypothetical protein